MRGLCVSSIAVVRTRRKDSTPFVILREELALRPGIAVFERFFDPSKDTEVTVNGDNVTKYPKLDDFVTYEIKVKRFETDKEGHMIIKDGLAKQIKE